MLLDELVYPTQIRSCLKLNENCSVNWVAGFQ